MGGYNPATSVSVEVDELRRALYIAGATDVVSTPDHADFAAITRLELVHHCALADWSTGGAQILMAQQAGVGNFAWDFLISAGNAIQLRLSNDGTVLFTAIASISTVDVLGFLANVPRWLKCTWSGAAGLVDLFYAEDSDSEPTDWTPIPLTSTPVTGTLFNSTSLVTVGAGGAITTQAFGRHYRSIIRSAIGGSAIADLNLNVPFADRYRDQTGKIWTRTGTSNAWTLGKGIAL